MDLAKGKADLTEERAVLGAALIDHDAAIQVLGILRRNDLFLEVHRLIWDAFEDLVADHQPIDMITVSAKLKSLGSYERVGKASYLSTLVDSPPDIANVVWYARLVKAQSLKRRLGVLSMEASKIAGSELSEDELDAEIGCLMAGISDILREATMRRGGARRAIDVAREVAKRTQDLANGGVLAVGLPTGLEPIDQAMQMQPQDLVIIGGSPSTGKSSLALQWAVNAAVCGHVALLFSLEMSAEAICQRLLAQSTGTAIQLFVNGKLNQWGANRLAQKAEEVPRQLWIDDTGGLTVNEMRARCRALVTGGELGFVGVDYLQLVHASKRARSKEERAAEVVTDLKELAKELGVPVVAVSQLSREANRAENGPELHHLRDSGMIEAAADVVLLTWMKPGDKTAVIKIGKYRQGPAGQWIKLAFDGLRTMFVAQRGNGWGSDDRTDKSGEAWT